MADNQEEICMKNELLHIFRNSPFGREVLLQSIYFCLRNGVQLRVYIPEHSQFLMYFPEEAVAVDLGRAFLRSQESAKKHAKEIIRSMDGEAGFLQPKSYTASTLPDIPVDFGFMTCPRTISDLSSKLSFGHIGPGARLIIKNARFPLIIPTPFFKEWKHILVFFGGSRNAVKAFRLGIRLQGLSGLPLELFTHAEGKPRSYYEQILDEHDLLSHVQTGGVRWIFMEKGSFREALYDISHEALIIVGAHGHGVMKEILFGSMMEHMQTILPNNLVIVGPHYTGDA